MIQPSEHRQWLKVVVIELQHVATQAALHYCRHVAACTCSRLRKIGPIRKGDRLGAVHNRVFDDDRVEHKVPAILAMR